jgi:hypothetical protein
MGGLRRRLRRERRQRMSRGASDGREARAGALSPSGRGHSNTLSNQYPIGRESLDWHRFVSIVWRGPLLASNYAYWDRILESGGRRLRRLGCLHAENR